jgi:hypothetical protein
MSENVVNLSANDFRAMAEGSMSKLEKGTLINKCMLSKIISDIRFEVMFCSISGIYHCNVSVGHNVITSDEMMHEIMCVLKEKFEKEHFEVSIGENMISLDWSKEGPYGDIEDEYDDYIEQYENMHKQKAKKHHAPKRHNLKVVK